MLGASADGADYGRTTGYAYWTGTWDGDEFHTDSDEPAWLDDGADFYAAVTWTDDRATTDEQRATRYAMGWVNNWAYARDLPTTNWQGGAQSLVRELALVDTADGPRLRSTPIKALDVHASVENQASAREIATGDVEVISDGEPVARRVRLALSRDAVDDGRLDLVIGTDDARVTVQVDAADSVVSIDRSMDGAAASLPDVYRQIRSTPFVWNDDGMLMLDVILDGLTLEVFVQDGEAALSSVVFVGSSAMSLESAGRTVSVDSIEVHRLLP